MKKPFLFSVIALATLVATGCHLKSQPASERVNYALKFCESMSLIPEDAENWEWTPDYGYWCTNPKGCSIMGNKAQVGTRLAFALPLPLGQGYENNNESPVSEWVCTLEEGCACGTGRVKKYGKCYGDMYPAEDTQSGVCNIDNCDAFCKNDQCVCGEDIVPKDKFNGLTCSLEVNICDEAAGCKVEEHSYSLHESWMSTELKCYEEEGCQCGKSKCREYDVCVVSEERCVSNNSGADEPAVIPEGYIWNDDDEALECETTGCVCGSQVCHEGFQCIDGACTRRRYAEEDYLTFYCDKPEGCVCGANNNANSNICPRGSVCGYSGHFFECSKSIGEDDKSATETSFEFWSKHLQDDYDLWDDEEKFILFSKSYSKKSDFEKDQNYFLFIVDNEKVKMSVKCSVPGCDCNGTPLKKDYICAEHQVISGTAEYQSWPYQWMFCRDPFERDRNDDCSILQKGVEQVCFNPDGCACGTNKIARWDVCVNGQEKCSVTYSKPGCDCNGTPLEEGYSCYQGKMVCQPNPEKDDDSCMCHGNKIHRGDICTADQIICGGNSKTTGCLCDGMPLREGYRCLLGEQRCACLTDEEDKCPCQCGDQKIMEDVVCKNDNTAIIPEVVEAREVQDLGIVDGQSTDLLSCGDWDVVIRHPNGDLLDRDDMKILDIEDAKDQYKFCTCGTMEPPPGKEYICSFDIDQIGEGCDWELVSWFKGWQCTDFGGCKCENEVCMPGDVCNITSEGKGSCDKGLRYDGPCSQHKLASSIIEGGYKCYDGNVNAEGWYCEKAEGCDCGGITCEQWQMCITPGHCGKYKLEPGEEEHLTMPIIENSSV